MLKKKLTKEHKEKLSKAHLGKTPWNKGMKGKQIAWNKGLIGYGKNYIRSKEWGEKISSGKKNSIKSTLASKKAGKNVSKLNFGRKHSKETKQKHRLLMLKDRNPNWCGGKSFEKYGIGWTEILKESIRKRDKHVCQICNKSQNELMGFYKKLDVHHIDYNKKNLDPKNLISLCRKCHLKTNKNRNYWITYFKQNDKSQRP